MAAARVAPKPPPGLDEAIDVIDQQKNVFASTIAEMLGDGERRQPRPPTRARRLIHLAEDQRGTREHAGLAKFEQQLVPLARTLSDPSCLPRLRRTSPPSRQRLAVPAGR
jgi:hypothetical protein